VAIGLACEPSKGGNQGTTNGNLTTWTDSANSGSTGIATFEIDLGKNDEGFLLTAESSSYVAVEAVYDPSGNTVLYWEDWYYEEQSLTEAIFSSHKDLIFNWPIREEDGSLSKGTWTIDVGTLDSNYNYKTDVKVDATIQTKTDSSFSGGTIKAEIVFVDGLEDDSDVVSATDAAVERWQEVWDGAGLTLDVSYSDANIDGDLAFPDEGDSDLVGVSESGSNSDIAVVIGETIDGSMEYYGVAGGIPGTLVSGDRSTVVISWLANAGGDGSFSDDDIRLFGETLAHEVGHYTGLFHPVESDYSYWDAIDDTTECSNSSSCESALGDNLMFPYPVCDYSSCTPQDELTDGQQGVAHRYTGTL